MAERAAHLVDEVLPPVPVRQWVLSLPYPLRYRLAYDHELCRAVLAVHLRAVLSFQRRRARKLGIADGRGGAVTVIQRFGSGLRLNLHFHSLVLDGVFSTDPDSGEVRFTDLPPPTDAEVARLLLTIARRVARLLERRGLLTDPFDPQADASPALASLQQASVRGVQALGPEAGRLVRRVRDPSLAAAELGTGRPLHAHLEGFDLHAAVAVHADDREGLERLCRYLARPAVAQDRLELLSTGRVRVEVKHPWRDGTTHLDFEPLDFIGRLAAFVPRPRTNLVLYHGVLAPNARLRSTVVSYGRDVSGASNAARKQGRPLRRRHGERWAWADLMRRTFELDVLECPHCGGRLRLLAAIADRRTARAILEHIADRQTPRAPPAASPAPTLH